MTMTMTKHHALYFTAAGGGPDNVRLFTQSMPEDRAPDGRLICERTLGLRFDVDAPALFLTPGGFAMTEATVRALHRLLGAWLDTPITTAEAMITAAARSYYSLSERIPDDAPEEVAFAFAHGAQVQALGGAASLAGIAFEERHMPLIDKLAAGMIAGMVERLADDLAEMAATAPTVET